MYGCAKYCYLTTLYYTLGTNYNADMRYLAQEQIVDITEITEKREGEGLKMQTNKQKIIVHCMSLAF